MFSRARRDTSGEMGTSQSVIQASAPAHIVESDIPTEALLAYIAVSKYGDGLPLYRQEAIFLREHVEVDRGIMARWMGKLGCELEILADYISARSREANEYSLTRRHCSLVPGSGSAETAYLWAYARDDRPFGGSGPPMVAYRFEDSRSGDCVARHLESYRGILQIDGYTAYNRVARPDRGNDGALLAGCWAHSRRRFDELHANDSSKVATATIEKMGALWSIEEKVRGQRPDVRVAARQEASAAVVADLFVSAGTLSRFCHSYRSIPNEEFRGGGIVEVSASDRELIAVMRHYFAAKAELESLKAQLEAARQAAGEAIGVFYDPRQNAEHASDLERSHRLKGEMVALMQRAEAWGRSALAVDQNDGSEAEPEEWHSFSSNDSGAGHGRGEPLASRHQASR
ncbi:hypothetical protein CN934_30040 [Ensifer sp. MMN_5]|nr:hypothetical protein CN934_30040 [Ensifer sp. MMN_5]